MMVAFDSDIPRLLCTYFFGLDLTHEVSATYFRYRHQLIVSYNIWLHCWLNVNVEKYSDGASHHTKISGARVLEAMPP